MKTPSGSASCPNDASDFNTDWRTCQVGEISWDDVFRKNKAELTEETHFQVTKLTSSLIIIPESWQTDMYVFRRGVAELSRGTKVFIWQRIR